jgi:hypothetical protein
MNRPSLNYKTCSDCGYDHSYEPEEAQRWHERNQAKPRPSAPINIRHVHANGTTYLRLEDVVSYIREIAGSEETDVRNRLNEAANNLTKKPT